jgi:MFS family permease
VNDRHQPPALETSSGSDASPTFRSALRHRDFRVLLLGHGAGTIGQLMMTLAVGIEVLQRTSSHVWLSVTVALGFVPFVVFSGYAGVLADRWSRSVVLTWSFASRVVCALVVGTGLWMGWPVPLLVAVTALAAVLATPCYPALVAATPECVPDDQLPPANALVTGVVAVAWIAGPGVLGLVVLAGYGPVVAVYASAALFAGAALLAARVRLPRPAGALVGTGTWSAMFSGLRVVATRARVRRPMTVAVIDNFLYGYLVVAMVLLAEEVLGGRHAVGWLNAGMSAGALSAMAVVNRLASQRRPGPVLFAVMATFAVSAVLIGLSDGLPLTVALVVVAGAATLVAEVIAVTLLQRAAPHNVVARVFGVYDQLNIGAIAAGSMLTGPLTDRLGAATALVVVAVGCLAASSVVTWRMRGRGSRAARHRVAVVALHTAPGARHARRDPTWRTTAARWSVKRARQPVDDGVKSTVS